MSRINFSQKLNSFDRLNSEFSQVRSNEEQESCCMFYLIIKAMISGVIIAAASEIAKRNPGLGAIIISLPLVSILAMIWLWRDTGDTARIAAYSEASFWFVLPSLPMFLVFPAMLRHGIGFWSGLTISCILTMGLYLLTIFLLPKIGINL